ncbi:hypothetical protein T01_2378 [Trichinella spiralis]|uniref:Uncharacterized protein n=1 Tax=Trichinella spiralis TaxID=6334 RepID=A0A0V0ZSB5_TRISP|nr:hypothetical protein T01_2378 [Trichinella spiralis]
MSPTLRGNWVIVGDVIAEVKPGKYCAIKCFGRSLREYANFYLPWGIA